MSSPAVHPCTDTCHGSVCVFVCACVAAAVVVVVAEISWVLTDIDEESEEEGIDFDNPIALSEDEDEEQDDAMINTEPQSKKEKKAADKAAKCVPLLGSFQSPAEVDRSIDRSREIATLIDSRSVPLKLEFLLETWLHTNLACHRKEAKKKKKKEDKKNKKNKKKTKKGDEDEGEGEGDLG